MGLPSGWVTNQNFGLTHAQQLTALGNGVLPRQAVAAIRILARSSVGTTPISRGGAT